MIKLMKWSKEADEQRARTTQARRDYLPYDFSRSMQGTRSTQGARKTQGTQSTQGSQFTDGAQSIHWHPAHSRHPAHCRYRKCRRTNHSRPRCQRNQQLRSYTSPLLSWAVPSHFSPTRSSPVRPRLRRPTTIPSPCLHLYSAAPTEFYSNTPCRTIERTTTSLLPMMRCPQTFWTSSTSRHLLHHSSKVPTRVR